MRGVTSLGLEIEGVRLDLDPGAGGRVTSLRRGDFEVLSGRDVHADNYGSTFWTSPQSDWGWPPPAEIDRGPYSVAVADETIELSSAPVPALGVRVTKRFSADLARRAFVIEYAVHNVSATPKACAPWEVTRVASRGLTFFPTRASSSGTLVVAERYGATWFAHDPALLPREGKKAFAASRGGWLAHATPAKGAFVYVKRFDEVPLDEQAPGEAEIEIYANDQYVELEVQGRFATIAPGSSTSWTVRWYLRELSEGIVATAPNADLLAFVDRAVR